MEEVGETYHIVFVFAEILSYVYDNLETTEFFE
jgi:hypothetical protein